MKIIDKDKYQDWKDRNTDPYGNACFEYAEKWAELMEERIADGEKIVNIANETSKIADEEFGVTGFMYGMAVSILAYCWEHGETLRQWHNLDVQIGNEGEEANKGEGILNPALLNISIKE